MKVAMYYANNNVRIQEQDVPVIGPGEILMKVHASGICGSDVMEWYRRDKVPLVLGHEVAGEVVEVGEGVSKFAVGDRIAASHHVPCFSCRHCHRGHPTACDTIRSTTFHPGGFAQYVRLPKINVDLGTYALPEKLSYAEGSFAEPLACVLRGQEKIGIEAGMNVLVIGAGVSGIMHIELARALGAGTIVATDLSPYRLEQAERFGADATFTPDEYSPEKFREVCAGRLADRVILTAGAIPAIQQGLDSAERGATVLVFAPTDEGVRFPFDMNKFFWREDRTLTTTYAGEPADHVHALDLIAAGRFRAAQMITHRLPLDEIQQGFDLVAGGTECLKVVIEPHA
ncbi:MAG: alcohol dehydrogenase catalytic domain-containing protein [Candidatus Lernaella stagnicola]|nr:alcohol dehydrogenase catalytic domain-containing protein [Candidatus Lernaella stagnicola]